MLAPLERETKDSRTGWMPYEFSFNPTFTHYDDKSQPVVNKVVEPVDLKHEKYSVFLSEFADAVRNACLEQVVGLRVFPGPTFQEGLEIHRGKASIWLTPGQVRINTFILSSILRRI